MLRMRIPGLLFGSAMILIALGAACATPWTPPTAAEILTKPRQSTMNDGHFKITGHIASGAYSTDVTGDGIMAFKPQYALSMRLQGSVGQIPFAVQQIEINGRSYSRVGDDKWSETEATNEPGNIAGATGARLMGEETLKVGKSWHVRATNSSAQSFDMWVRESDGYLAKYSGTTDSASINIEFDRYNTKANVSAPPAADIKPPAKQLTGRVGEALSLNGLTVSVLTADVNAKPDNEFSQPKPGNRYVVIQVLYENTGSNPVSYNPFDWKLGDASGFTYDPTYSGIGQDLHSGDLATGEKARGYISYEVPQTASGLRLKFQHEGDSATVPIGP